MSYYTDKRKKEVSERLDDISVTFTGIAFCVFFLPSVILQFFLDYIRIPNFEEIYRGICLVAFVSGISLGLSVKYDKYKVCGILTLISIIIALSMCYKALIPAGWRIWQFNDGGKMPSSLVVSPWLKA